MRRAFWACLFSGALALAPVRSFAQERDATAAEALFREGRDAATGGDYKRACEKFRESNRLDPAPGTVLNIADCEEKLGRIATAWTLFREVTERVPESDERHQVAAKRATALEPRLPKLSLKLAPGAPEGTRVLRDGVELKSASLESALPVDPGKHVISVQAPGHAPSESTITIAEGENKTETVAIGPASAEPKGEHGEITTDDKSGRRTIGYVLGGIGIVGVGVGAVTGIMVLGKKKTADDNCPNKRCNQEGFDAAEDGKKLGTISGISFAVGALGLAGGAYFLLTSGSKEKPTTALAFDGRQVSLVRSF
jgi:hypothetical protein